MLRITYYKYKMLLVTYYKLNVTYIIDSDVYIIISEISISAMNCQDLMAEKIMCKACNLKIAGSIQVHGHLATPFSKEFNLAMLTVAEMG